jgi:hypothetical protein
MKWILWLNTVGETIIALGMFAAPASFFPGAAGVAPAIARAFSFAILTVAFISLSVSGRDVPKPTLRTVVNILLAYHVLQLIAQFVNMALHPPLLIPPVIIHVVYSSLFAVYAMRLRQAG